MIKTNIKMRVTPGQSRKIQEICFENGITKISDDINKINENHFLFIFYDRIGFDRINEEDFFNSYPPKEVDTDLFIRTNGTYIEKEEFKYPMWFKSKKWGYVVKFTDLRHGIVVIEGIHPTIDKDFNSSMWTAHTDSVTWEQIENPNEHLDRLDDIVDEAIKEVSKEDSHNAHYKAQKIDTITRCKANMTLEQQKAICIFQIDRYTHREKGQNLSDIKKIRDYLDWMEEIEKELENER